MAQWALLLAGLLWGLPAGAFAAADSASAPPRRIPVDTSHVFREVRSTPYPGGAMYVNQGITGAFMGGRHRNLGEHGNLFQWQGEVTYFYTSWFSAGVGFLITAGEPSDTTAEVRNRYFIQARWNRTWDKFALFAGPKFGMDNLNNLTGSRDSSESSIRRRFKETRPGLGLDVGGGWKFSRWVGLTFGVASNYSFVGGETSIFGNELNVHLLPGLAVDLLSFTDTMRELVPALYLSAEYQGGFLLFERGARRNDRGFIAGLSVAF